MKKLLILLLCSALFYSDPVFGWGREGHETIAKIAERNLTKRAKKRIEKYLGGHSIVYYAKWMDEYRKTPEYAFTDGWHTAPVDARLHYSDELLNPKRGNAIYGLESAIRILENYREQSDSTVAVNLKYVIHLVGDMHCPAHIKYATHDMKYDVLFEDKYRKAHKFYVHSVWDNEIITVSRIWSVSEWADELDRLPKSDKQAIAAGTPATGCTMPPYAAKCSSNGPNPTPDWDRTFSEQGPASGRKSNPKSRIPARPFAERSFRLTDFGIHESDQGILSHQSSGSQAGAGRHCVRQILPPSPAASIYRRDTRIQSILRLPNESQRHEKADTRQRFARCLTTGRHRVGALFAYAVGKFVNGFIADYCNIKRFMATGLVVSASANALMGVLGLAQSVIPTAVVFVAFAVMWGLNGWAQSMGAPPAIISLSRWYPLKERGTYYGFFSASHNLGEFFSFLFVGSIVTFAGWQAGFSDRQRREPSG